MRAEKKKRMEEEGIITDYTTLDKEEIKKTLLWQKKAEEVKKIQKEAEEKPYDRKKTQKNREIQRKGVDKYIEEKVYYYQKVHQETYEVQMHELEQAKITEKRKLKRIGEKPRNKDYQ